MTNNYTNTIGDLIRINANYQHVTALDEECKSMSWQRGFGSKSEQCRIKTKTGQDEAIVKHTNREQGG